MSLSSLVLTSVMLAFLQYLESDGYKRIDGARTKLADSYQRDNNLIDKFTEDEAKRIRSEYDHLLSNETIIVNLQMKAERLCLYLMLLALSILHLLDSILRIADVGASTWLAAGAGLPTAVLMAWVGIGMKKRSELVAGFEGSCRKLLERIRVAKKLRS